MIEFHGDLGQIGGEVTYGGQTIGYVHSFNVTQQAQRYVSVRDPVGNNIYGYVPGDGNIELRLDIHLNQLPGTQVRQPTIEPVTELSSAIKPHKV